MITLDNIDPQTLGPKPQVNPLDLKFDDARLIMFEGHPVLAIRGIELSDDTLNYLRLNSPEIQHPVKFDYYDFATDEVANVAKYTDRGMWVAELIMRHPTGVLNHGLAYGNPNITAQFGSFQFLIAALFPVYKDENREKFELFKETLREGYKKGKPFAILFGHGSEYDSDGKLGGDSPFGIGEEMNNDTFVHVDLFLNTYGKVDNEEQYCAIGIIACNGSYLTPKTTLTETKVFYVSGTTSLGIGGDMYARTRVIN